MSANPTRIALVAAVLTLAGPVHAQQGKRYALLVGVTEYDSSTFTTLKYAENDAESVNEVLVNAGYDEVVVLTTSRGKKDKTRIPSASNLRAALEKLSGKVKRGDLLLVGLSGHGLLWTVLDEKTKKERDESFFCPSDARPRSGKTSSELSTTMIPIGELFRTLDESGAGVRLMLVDACRNEVKGGGRNIDVDHLPRTKKGTAVLFSCKAGERAFESEKLKHGVFFHHVIEGLKGEAKDRKGKITWASLVEHVVEKVTEDVPTLIGGGARQTPHEMKNLEGLPPLMLPSKTKTGDDSESLFQEGMDSFLGMKRSIDYERALKLLRQAAAKGHPVAAGRAGVMVYLGVGTDRNEGEGTKLIETSLPGIRKKAEEADTDAQSLLGLLLQQGLGVAANPRAALDWYTRAAEKGNVGAMNNLALVYERSDPKVAIEWYTRAADKGLPAAMARLGLIYAKGGVGVRQDDAKAVAYFRKAADRGHQVAMINLGECYEKGLGVEQSKDEALRWYRKAAAQGNEEGKRRARRLEANR